MLFSLLIAYGLPENILIVQNDHRHNRGIVSADGTFLYSDSRCFINLAPSFVHLDHLFRTNLALALILFCVASSDQTTFIFHGTFALKTLIDFRPLYRLPSIFPSLSS